MSNKNAEEHVRISTEEFEEQFEYENPFERAAGHAPVDLEEVSLSIRDPEPVSSQTKPAATLPEETDDEEKGRHERPRAEGKGQKAKQKTKQKSGSRAKPSVPESSKPSESSGGNLAPSGARSESQPLTSAKETSPSVGAKGKGNETDHSAESGLSTKDPHQSGSPSRGARRSSELSPFALTQSRLRGSPQRVESAPSGVRIGGVASPPASDAASIAGRREDEEDPLDESLGDPEDLMEALEKKEKSGVKPKAPAQSTRQRAHERSASILSSGPTPGIDSVVANSHEIRIMALEKQVAMLIDQNQLLIEQKNELAEKTDVLIKEVSKIRAAALSDAIVEMNERMKRVGGPTPAVTVTAPSPIVNTSEDIPAPSNVVPSSPTVSSPVALQDGSVTNLTGEALRRYLRRQRMRS